MNESRLYMDACCFIDMVKHEVGKQTIASEDDIWHLKKLMEAAKNGDLAVYTSTLSIAECTHVCDPTDSTRVITDEVKLLFKKMLTSGQCVRLIQDSIFVAERARDLLWEEGMNFRGADAIHVASALEAKCTELVTTDEPVRKHKIPVAAKGLAIIYARETGLLPPEYRQGKIAGTE